MFIEPKQFRISVSSKLNTSGPMSTRLNRPIFLTLVNHLCTMPQIRLKVKQFCFLHTPGCLDSQVAKGSFKVHN